MTAMTVIGLWVAGVAVGLVDNPPPVDRPAEILESLRFALVRVEYTLRYDQGQPPPLSEQDERVIREERPLERAGFLISDRLVVTADLLIPPRFVHRIAVGLGAEARSGRIAAVARQQRAVFLGLDEPLPGTRPLSFDPAAGPPYGAVRSARREGLWGISLEPLVLSLTLGEDGQRYLQVPDETLVVGGGGRPAGLFMSPRQPADETWKGTPADWPVMSAKELATALEDLKSRTDRCLLRVTLHFRSPREGSDLGSRFRYWMVHTGYDENAVERQAIGLLWASDRILVLDNLPAHVTARLERIIVHAADGREVPAQFLGSLRDHGALLAAPETPLEGHALLSGVSIPNCRDRLLLAARVSCQGEKRLARFEHHRIIGSEIGWAGYLYPTVAGDDDDLFLFDEGGALVALPVEHRCKVTVRDEWDDETPRLIPAALLAGMLEHPEKHIDPNNLPLLPEQENRLAWLGVELQPLNRQLARANGVSDLTCDGTTGALVTHVYPESPAARAGVEAGWILLRLHIPGHPRPLEVQPADDDFFSPAGFSWESLGELPADMVNDMPPPWPAVDNGFTRDLTELGFGTRYQAEFFVGGAIVHRDFEVVQSPPHYDSVRRFRSPTLGLTVRDLTYEVRRYFQKVADDPGVIVSRVEPGGKAAVAGIRAYEIITHVNDQPVSDVRAFERLIREGGTLRLLVSRMNVGRIVRIEAAPAAGQGLWQRLRSAVHRHRPEVPEGNAAASPVTADAEDDDEPDPTDDAAGPGVSAETMPAGSGSAAPAAESADPQGHPSR